MQPIMKLKSIWIKIDQKKIWKINLNLVQQYTIKGKKRTNKIMKKKIIILIKMEI
jgi:hypothetical protein